MIRLRRNSPILVSVVLAVIFPLLVLLGSLLLLLCGPGIYNLSEYLLQLAAELVMLAVVLVITAVLKMGYVFRPGTGGIRKNLMPTLAIVIYYSLALVSTVFLEVLTGTPLQSGVQIFWFVVCMLAIGLTEELTFRGLITRMILEKYGGTGAGVWLSVTVSGLLFGLVHLVNVGAGAELGGVLVQMVGAATLGMCLAAIYIRTGSIWTVALLHAYMDFCALISSGVFADGSIVEAVDSYDAASVLASLVYVLLALFLLRPKKMRALTVPGAAAPAREIGFPARRSSCFQGLCLWCWFWSGDRAYSLFE